MDSPDVELYSDVGAGLGKNDKNLWRGWRRVCKDVWGTIEDLILGEGHVKGDVRVDGGNLRG